MFTNKFTHKKTIKFYRTYISIMVMVTTCIMAITSCQKQSQSTDIYISQIAEDRRAGTILWSPVDSNELLVSTSQGEFDKTEVYLMDVETGEKQVIAQTDYGDIFAQTWSPDGSEIIIASLPGTRGFERGGLWIVGVNDGSVRFLQDEGNNVVWAPTQDQLTYVRTINRGADEGKTEIVLKNLKTQDETIIYTTTEIQEIVGLSWSPQGEKLAFAKRSVQPVGNFDIFVLEIESQRVIQITNGGDNTYPTWSPTRDHIAYRNKTYFGDKPIFSLHLIDSQGDCDIKLLESSLLTSSAWSSDGNKLAFVNLEGIYEINVLKFQTENPQGEYCR